MLLKNLKKQNVRLLEVKKEVMTGRRLIMDEVGEPVGLKENWSAKLDLMKRLV